jgi:DNA polymerase (family 10)
MPAKVQNNKAVGNVLREVALLLELKGENPFKVRAYSNAARSIETLDEEIMGMIHEGRVRDIEGVGETLAQQITELVETGSLQLLEELKRTIPPGHLEMLKIPGLGPKKIKVLSDTLHVQTIGELEYACSENRLIELQGFGQKSQEKILKGIQQVKKYQGRYLYGDTLPLAESVFEKIRSHPKVLRASLAGSLRRRMEIVGNVNLVVSTQRSQEVLTAVSKFPEVEVVHFGDGNAGHYSLASGVKIDLQTTSDQDFPYHLYRLTGSLSHWKAMTKKATALAFELNEQGLLRNGRPVGCKEEEDIFQALGIDFIPPELREDRGEIEAAEGHYLPRLICDQDLKGVFHVHSSFSDGAGSVQAMAEATRRMGFSYMGISDHSQSARYAGGLTLEKLRRQWEEVDRLNRETEGFHIFKGIESDILSDGSLDYEDDILKQFDFVIASVHSHFTMTEQEMTQRVIKALRNPYTTMLAHPTGRLLLSREPYPIDMTSIIDEAAGQGVAVELNAHPYRLDIDWRVCKYAKEKGVTIAINPDAHDPEGLKDTPFGVGIGRKGWLEPGDVLNTRSLEEMREYLKERSPWRRNRTRKG